MGKLKDSIAFTKWIRPIIIVTVAIVLVLSLGFGLLYWNMSQSMKEQYEEQIKLLEQQLADRIATYEEANTEVSLNVVNKEIKKIGELATVEYVYTNAGQYKNARQLFGVDIPTTTKRIIAKWDGTIKAGIKVDEIKTEIDEENKKILIYLPKAEILSHELDENSFETLNEKDGLFNEIKVDDVRQMDIVSKAEMEERAIDNGILEKAKDNAENVIMGMMYSNKIIAKNYTVEFRTAE